MAGIAAVGIGILQASSAAGEANAIKSANKFNARRLDFNKKVANISAKDAIKRGEEKVIDFKAAATRLKGSQRAALARQGINVDSGTAAGIQDETDKQIDTDIQRIRNNAWRESWGFKVEASGLETEKQLTGLAAENKASSTLIGGTLSGIGTAVGGFSK